MNLAVIGAQWGDEGKGGVMSRLLSKGYFKVTARYQGGPNAGHTIYVAGQPVVLHSLPSGVLNEGVVNVMGNGVVVNPSLVGKEIEDLEARGISLRERLYISNRSPVILPHHIALEYIRSKSAEIDTTKQGIGPCYAAHTDRMCPEVGNFYGPTASVQRLIKEYDGELNISERFDAGKREGRIPATLNLTLDAAKATEEYFRLFEKLGPCVTDTVYLMNGFVNQQRNIIFEGAQGTLLDRDHGTYPFVTSSSTPVGGIAVGLGIDPRHVDKVIGVAKVGYLTRVGNGCLPTELGDLKSLRGEVKLDKSSEIFVELERNVRNGAAADREIGRYMRVVGGEYGATTGRPRRTGWQDEVALNYAIMFGVDSLALTKLDVCDKVPEIKSCVAYKNTKTGETTTQFDPRHLEDYTPVYETQKGWMTDTTNARGYDDLPKNAQEIAERLGKYRPVDMICVGPEDHQTVWINSIF